MIVIHNVKNASIPKIIIYFMSIQYKQYNITGVFVTASKTESGGYDYNTTLVVFLSELLKLVISAVLYTYRRTE